MNIHLASPQRCTGCLACADSCHVRAIQPYTGRDGHLHVKINSSQCVECRQCMKICPVVSGYNFQDTSRRSQPYAVWANDDVLRFRSASGGLFAALAVYVLSQDGFVAGASMEGLEVKHILIQDVHELYKIQNSKYQQVDSSGIYNVVKEKLQQNKTVLFGGTSCQVAGLNCFLEGVRYSGKLYTIDMICSGFPSNQALKAFLKNESSDIQSLIYRDKTDGCLKGHRLSVIIDTPDKGRQIKNDPQGLVYATFGTHYTHRSNCLDCSFAYAQRKCDITMGDFWGDPDFPEEHQKGLSLAIVHSEKGRELLRSADITIHETAWIKVLRVNFRMIYGKFYAIRLHPARIFRNQLFRYCSYPVLLHLYRAQESYRNFLWIPYLVYSKLLGFIDKIFITRAVKNELKKLT